jgi:hypothetical protein
MAGSTGTESCYRGHGTHGYPTAATEAEISALLHLPRLERAMVRASVERHMPALKECYDAARARSPSLEGHLEAGLEVGPDGRVVGAD